MDKDVLNNFYRVKEKTKQGYSIASINDSIDLSRPKDTGHRGRVGKNKTHTLLTQGNIGVVVE